MRTRAWLFLMAVLATAVSCKRRVDLGFAVAVTIDPKNLDAPTVSSVKSLLINVTGAETWNNFSSPYAIDTQLTTGTARWVYRPAATTNGTLTFLVEALDADHHVVAFGSESSVLQPGRTVTLSIVLTPGQAPDDFGIPKDLGVDDFAVAPKAVGEPCVAGVDVCASGFCVDKFCCDAKCDGSCQACNLPGKNGVCSAIPNGNAPVHGNCAMKSPNDPVTPCNLDGKCDGAGACRFWPRGTPASPATCAANQYTAPDICDGTGGKLQPASVSCDPFKCNAAGDGCFGPPCADNSVCLSGKTCDGTTKSCGQLGLGRTCTMPEQCTSGFCVDGVCCNSACADQCQACDADPLQLGTCLAVTGAPHSNGGKRSPCNGNGLLNCGGTCNGTVTDACVYPPASQVCADPTCASNQGTPQVSCDGNGSCNVPAPAACPSQTNSTGVCAGNSCGIQCTQTYYANCDGKAANGCEVDTRSDNANCGGCGNDCAAKGQTCDNGACKCPTGFKPCGNACIQTSQCCTPQECGCVRTASGKDSECTARMRSRDYGWTCGANVCSPPLGFSSPTYQDCEPVCGINKMCCGSP